MRCGLASALVPIGFLFLASATTGRSAGPETGIVECVQTGEGSVTGRLSSVHEGKLTMLREGVEETFVLSAFREIVLGEVRTPVVPSPWTVWGAGGTLFVARRLSQGSAPETADLEGYGWQARNVPLASIRALAVREVLLGPAPDREDFDGLRESPPPASDRVMVAGKDGNRVLSCIVEAITDAGLTIVAGGQRTTVAWSEVRWAVLSPGAGAPAEAPGHLVELADGTRFRVQSFELREGTLTGRDADAAYSAEAGRVARIRISSDAYRYLSDVKPEAVSLQPFLDVVWQPRFDRAVTGGPLVLAGRAYGKGIGMDARTEMTFALDGAYSRFYAAVGVDQAAAGLADGLGRVVFRVLADGRRIYDSGPLTPADGPRQVSLDIGGAARLTLVADLGGAVSAGGNFADWAEARVVR